MPNPGLHIPRSLAILPLLLLAAVTTAPAVTLGPDLSKYPLRLHVLRLYTSGSHAPTLVAQSSGAAPDMDAGVGAPSMTSGNSVFPDWPPEFYGSGWGDLVSPPITTQGLGFNYDQCDSRVHLSVGYHSLAARWKKQGKQLEVLVPTETVPGKKTRPYNKCTINVTLQDNVYLILRNGKLVEVSQQDYAKKPALRAFISAPAEALEPRRTTTAPAK